jgi:hypothetical protein
MNLRTMSSCALLLALAACAAGTGEHAADPHAAAAPPAPAASSAAPVASVSPAPPASASPPAPEPPAPPTPPGCAPGTACSDASAPSHFAAIDLGTKGIKAFLFKLVQVEGGVYGEPVFHADAVTTLASGAKDNHFADSSITDAASAVAKLVAEMKDYATAHGLSPAYYVVGSSGVAAFANHDALKAAVDRASGLSLQFIDATAEGREGLLSSVPPSRMGVGLHVDIGSGNTKIGCMVDGAYSSVEIPFGTVTLTQAVPANGDFVTKLHEFMKTTVEPEYTAAERKSPCLEGRTYIYFIGGSPWAATTFVHPEQTYCKFVPFTAHELADFSVHLEKGTWRQPPPPHLAQQCAAEGDEPDPLKARQNVQDRFAQDNLTAGVSLMRLVLGRGNPNATALFARSGNYIYGYALEHYKDIRYATR